MKIETIESAKLKKWKPISEAIQIAEDLIAKGSCDLEVVGVERISGGWEIFMKNVKSPALGQHCWVVVTDKGEIKIYPGF